MPAREYNRVSVGNDPFRNFHKLRRLERLSVLSFRWSRRVGAVKRRKATHFDDDVVAVQGDEYHGPDGSVAEQRAGHRVQSASGRTCHKRATSRRVASLENRILVRIESQNEKQLEFRLGARVRVSYVRIVRIRVCTRTYLLVHS